MANIRRMKSGNWNVQVRIAGRSARSQTFHSRPEAEAWAKNIESRLNFRHPCVVDAGMEYCSQVLAGKASREQSEYLFKRLGQREEFQRPLDKVTLQHVNSYKKKRLSEVSSTTARNDLMKLRSLYRWYSNEWFARCGEPLANPCDRLELPKARKTRETVISRKQLSALLCEMTPLLAQIVELAYETAMRRSEILNLRQCDLHLDERFLRVVEGKEGSRDVPLTRRAVRLLEYAANRSDEEGAKLYSIAPYSVSQAVRRARIRLGMASDIRFHQLRHSRITEVARKGLNLSQVMVVSGHRDIRSVQRYTHLNVKDVIDLID